MTNKVVTLYSGASTVAQIPLSPSNAAALKDRLQIVWMTGGPDVYAAPPTPTERYLNLATITMITIQ